MIIFVKQSKSIQEVTHTHTDILHINTDLDRHTPHYIHCIRIIIYNYNVYIIQYIYTCTCIIIIPELF